MAASPGAAARRSRAFLSRRARRHRRDRIPGLSAPARTRRAGAQLRSQRRRRREQCGLDADSPTPRRRSLRTDAFAGGLRRDGPPCVVENARFPDMTQKSLFAPIAARFDFVFIDQYGVLHDGQPPYPGAIEALATLKAREARVVILSNSGRSAAYNAR